MYFKDRAEAGQKLADQLLQYRYENCVVISLNDGGVIVGEQIAAALHSILTVLLIENIDVPGEQEEFGTVDQTGSFVRNASFTPGVYDDYYSEFHGYLEDQKREKFQRMNKLLGDGGVLDHDLLRDHVIILVADALPDAGVLNAAAEFLKPVRIAKLITATPIASVAAVDRMHIMCDELHVLNVTDNFMGADHYYDKNDILPHEQIIELVNKAILRWQ